MIKKEHAFPVQSRACPDMAKSTLSNHFRILREAGLIRTQEGRRKSNTCAKTDIQSQISRPVKTYPEVIH